jgi:hypothetical protein
MHSPIDAAGLPLLVASGLGLFMAIFIWLKYPDDEISAEQTRATVGSRAGDTG